MKKSRIKKFYTSHGFERLEQRIDIQGAKFDVIARAAFKNGKVANQFPDGVIRNYLLDKERARNKRIKIYKGYVFVFLKTSHRVITCYPLSPRLKTEYEKLLLDKK